MDSKQLQTVAPDVLTAPVFDPATHVRHFASAEWLDCVDDLGILVPGVHGREGARGALTGGVPFGIDLIEMAPGGAFGLHVHEGAHILYVRQGKGTLTVGETSYELVPETTVFVPAQLPHAVAAIGDGASSPLVFLAIGVPHQPVDSRARMRTVRPGAL